MADKGADAASMRAGGLGPQGQMPEAALRMVMPGAHNLLASK